ncbi:MAG: nucleotidyltransferase family protein [Candidatus Sumerlaeia bacterium]|nr:nucleotidyltransferase family protein [Candidatus Sumerlaeia bacterium]
MRGLLAQPLDWDAAVRMAGRQGVLPLVCRMLELHAADAVPPEILAVWREKFRANARRSFALTVELVRILKSLQLAGIEAIPYKGPVLAAYVYGDPALRQFADLDLLVRPSDVRRAKDVLLAQDYRLVPPLTPAQERAQLRWQWEYALSRNAGAVHVELHWRLAPRTFSLPLPIEPFWERKIAVPLHDTPVDSLSPEDLLLALSIHAYKHYWERLEWLVAASQLVRLHPHMDWPYLERTAGRAGACRIVAVTLALSELLAGVPLAFEPAQWTARYRPNEAVVRGIAAMLWGPPASRRRAAVKLRVRWAARERLCDRLRCLVLRLLVPTADDWRMAALPGALYPLYYPLRLIRLTVQGAGALISQSHSQGRGYAGRMRG